MSIQIAVRSKFPLVEITPSPIGDDGGYVISPLPRPGTPPPAFQPFPLAVPQALLEGLLVLGQYRSDDDCHLAALLLVNTRTRQWALELPKQTSHAVGVSWQVDSRDLALLPPNGAIGGSFQTRPDADEVSMLRVVPPFNGLHVIVGVCADSAKRYVHLFVRHGDQIDHVPPQAVIIDDWLQALQHHLPRMTLA